MIVTIATVDTFASHGIVVWRSADVPEYPWRRLLSDALVLWAERLYP